MSFNPCFGGSYIVTRFPQCYILSPCSFNPCFGGSYIVTVGALEVKIIGVVFQSLFWWILYCDLPPLDRLYFLLIVSILVLVDLIL